MKRIKGQVDVALYISANCPECRLPNRMIECDMLDGGSKNVRCKYCKNEYTLVWGKGGKGG